jgi:hypothetical protein
MVMVAGYSEEEDEDEEERPEEEEDVESGTRYDHLSWCESTSEMNSSMSW